MKRPSVIMLHPSNANHRTQEQRRRIAVEAAKLIAEQGIRDYHQAALKAAERLRITNAANLPRNSEIEDALREHQRLFRAGLQPRTLRHLREVALEAMRFFSRFEPRLVGTVLEGTADEHSAICLHLFADNPQDVALFLHENGIPYQERNRRLRLTQETSEEFPAFLFTAENTAIDLTVLPHTGLRQAPLDQITERPMRRASLGMLKKLLSS